MLGLYIHIPFCKAICTYCDFAKEVASSDKQDAYLNALNKEFEYYQDALKNVKTIYIGGGTPSALSDIQLNTLFTIINTYVNTKNVIEYTIEANPNDITLAKANLFKKNGINRVSLGVQTFNEKILKVLNRKHVNEDVYNGLKLLQDAAIHNINIDLIFNLPYQSIDNVKEDLKAATQLPITHISYYSLIVEENTKLYYDIQNKKLTLNDEDIEGEMYETIIDTLTSTHFDQYEISNYAKKGYQSKHNLVYWKNEDYIGIGAGSHGKYLNERYYNTRSVKFYIENVLKTNHGKASRYPYEPLRDTMLMGLRLTEGVNLKEIKDRFDIELLQAYPKLEDYIKEGLLELSNHYLRFTRKGILIGNIIFSLF